MQIVARYPKLVQSTRNCAHAVINMPVDSNYLVGAPRISGKKYGVHSI